MIGVQTSTAQANFLEKYFKDVIEIRQYKTTEQHDLDLAAGRVDGVFASISYLKGVVEAPENKEMMLAGPALRRRPPRLRRRGRPAQGRSGAAGEVRRGRRRGGGRRHREDDVDEVVRLRHHAGALRCTPRARGSEVQVTDYAELMGFGPRGWGLLMLQATLMTVAVSATAFALGSVLGALIAWARIEGNRPLQFARRCLHDGAARHSRPAGDLPALLRRQRGIDRACARAGRQGLRRRELRLPPGRSRSAIISGAYQSEIFRGAYQAIARGELEAARSVGMPRWLLFRRIIVPQALRFAIPGLGNVWQLALKESALISVVGLTEILRQAQVGAGSTRQPFAFFITAAALYLHALHDLGLGLPARGDRRRCAACGGA